MKQRKITPVQGKTVSPSTTRQELEECVKHIVQVVEKDPKKVAHVFKGWIDGTAQNDKKKRAA